MHVRRELEFEFRSKLINLRQSYLEAIRKKEVELIAKKTIPTLLPIFYGLLYLKGMRAPESIEGIQDIIEKRYKINLEVLKSLQNNNSQYSEETIKKLIILLSTLSDLLDEIKI